MNPRQNGVPKGLLAKLLAKLGITPTPSALIKARVVIIVVCVAVIAYLQLNQEHTAKKYGNYEQMQKQTKK
ncbi:MAG: hypothetical protein RLZZ480_404 [Candidatus Parcubacteria bacterium]|jgi:hypothetical protein